jgi:hypothetical protein
MMRRSLFWPAPVLGAAMVMAACGGTGAGAPAAQTSAAPGIDGGCQGSDQHAEGLPPSYRPVGDALEGDLRGDGRPSRATILGDEERPPRCRYFLGVEDPESTDSYAPIEGASSLPHDLPSLLKVVQIDGEPGLEVVVEFGGPMHPHRPGQIFTFDEGSLVAMRTERPRFEGGRPILFPLHGEFAGGVDCTGEPGAIVVTSGDLAEGGTDDSRYEVTRTFYRAEGGLFVETRREMHTVEVGTERERWPELADDPFRSCSRGA